MRIAKIVAPVIGVLLFAAPVFVSAQTADDIRAQIQSLLSQITALQAQLSNLTFNTPTTISTSSNSCPNLYRALSRGSRGSDVISLQQFLIAQGLLNGDSATGFFGSMTEAAVQRWQAQNGVDSVGIVGVRTRAAIAARCGMTTPPVVQSCPQYQIPMCVTGQHVQRGATDANGCQGAPMCVTDISSSPSINVTAPASGTNVTLGNSMTVSWQGRDLPDATQPYEKVMRVEAVRADTGTLAWSVVDGADETGSYSWSTVGTTPGAYRIRASWETYGLCVASTNSSCPSPTVFATAESGIFTITASIATPSPICLAVVYPEPQCGSGQTAVAKRVSAVDSRCPYEKICVPTGSRAPQISSISGPDTVQVGVSSQWYINANDPDGTTLSFSGNWGDAWDINSQSPTITHSYKIAGPQKMFVIARDASGQEALGEKLVTVLKADGTTGKSCILSGLPFPEGYQSSPLNPEQPGKTCRDGAWVAE